VEDGAPAELELQGFLVEDRHPGDVGGQQVRRTLDPGEGAAHGERQRPGQHGLGDTGHVLQEHVALTQEADQREPDGVALADDDLLDIVDDGTAQSGDIHGKGLRE